MTRRSLLTLLFMGILLASCGPSAAGQPTPDMKGTIEANAQTMVAALFLTQTALAPSATNTSLPTVTLLPSSTALAMPSSSPTVFVAQPVYLSPTPTGTYYTATPLPSSLGVGCNNLRLISSYTVPDSPLNPGQDFTQVWKVENNGTCAWMFVYALTYVSGDKLGEATSIRLSNKFDPGKWTTFEVTMHAPKNSGTYKSSWKLTDGSKPFGEVLPVSITVGGPTNTPKAPTQTPDLRLTAEAINTAIAGTLTKEAENAAGTASAVAATNAAGTATCAADPLNSICAP